MRMLLRSVLAVLLFALLTGPALAAEGAAASGVRWAHPALWRIDGGKSTIYLFGSVHIIPGNLAWSDDTIDGAMHGSDVFVFEASLSGKALADMRDVVRTQGVLPNGQVLRGLLSRDGLADYLGVLQELGIQPQSLDRFRPWLALFYISMRHTTSRAVTAPGSVDPTVMSFAQSHGKEMRYFETARQQLEIFGDMDQATELATFEASLAQYHERPQQTAMLLDAWSKGDSETLAGMLIDTFKAVPAARRALIEDRNRTWARQIEAFAREPNRTFFVTVGAGHFGGPSGVLPLLCAAGLRVVSVGRDRTIDMPACSTTRGSLIR